MAKAIAKKAVKSAKTSQKATSTLHKSTREQKRVKQLKVWEKELGKAYSKVVDTLIAVSKDKDEDNRFIAKLLYDANYALDEAFGLIWGEVELLETGDISW